MCLCSCTPCEGIHAQVTSQRGGGGVGWPAGAVGPGSAATSEEKGEAEPAGGDAVQGGDRKWLQ